MIVFFWDISTAKLKSRSDITKKNASGTLRNEMQAMREPHVVGRNPQKWSKACSEKGPTHPREDSKARSRVPDLQQGSRDPRQGPRGPQKGLREPLKGARDPLP